ncbi:MAG: family 20 glycosylhydrolase [Armatimonadetes bacterium]|nr:family 20 glycosylhydrolase [Armatimonadota bacterium]
MIDGKDLYLAPMPKKISRSSGVFNIEGKRYIVLDAKNPQSLIPAAKMTGLDLEITASPRVPKQLIGAVIRLDDISLAKIVTHASKTAPEGYKLTISPKGIEITARTPAGAFYGACTLAQILRQSQSENSGSHNQKSKPRNVILRCLSISDWPDFPARGVMIDISRDKVPTMETLYHIVDLLSEWKINQLQLYTEHTFAYPAHPTVWEKASPVTGEEIMALDAYCRERFIELVPNQNSFGHMERWLKHAKYRPMAEAPRGCDTEWGHFDYPFSLCPSDKRTIPFIKGLYEELLPHFTSQMFNVGLDETIDLGCGRSKTLCQERGTGRVYLDFVLEIYRLVKEHGRTMQFWGDIILKYPELICELPKDIIALEWGYEADHPFAEHGAKFRDSGIPFYVCPGTSSWNALAGRTTNAIENIVNAATNGKRLEAIGLLNTDWGDNGHWQPLSVSYLGFLAGAMVSWNSTVDPKKTIVENLSIHAFGDRTGKMGRAFYDLGDIYRRFKKRTFNSTVPWQMLFRDMNDPKFAENLSLEEFAEMERRLKEIADTARGDDMHAVDAEIVREEFAQVIKMLQLAADVGRIRLGTPKPRNLASRVAELKRKQERVWLLRNRPGGLQDSLSKIKIG